MVGVLLQRYARRSPQIRQPCSLPLQWHQSYLVSRCPFRRGFFYSSLHHHLMDEGVNHAPPWRSDDKSACSEEMMRSPLLGAPLLELPTSLMTPGVGHCPDLMQVHALGKWGVSLLLTGRGWSFPFGRWSGVCHHIVSNPEPQIGVYLRQKLEFLPIHSHLPLPQVDTGGSIFTLSAGSVAGD